MIKVIDHLLVQEYLSKIRRKGIDSSHFRIGIMEIGRLMSYEFANTLEKDLIKVRTPLGMADGIKIKDRKDIVIISVLRASLPLTFGVMRVFSEAQTGVIGAWREDKPPFRVKMDYIKIPNLNQKIVIVTDPMLATGNTMDLILEMLKKYGKPRRIVLFCVISSETGMKKIQDKYPELEFYTCSVEEKINPDGYIIPGMGDAGDIAFGKPSK